MFLHKESIVDIAGGSRKRFTPQLAAACGIGKRKVDDEASAAFYCNSLKMHNTFDIMVMKKITEVSK